MTTRKHSILSAVGALPLLFATAITADDRPDNEEKVNANLSGYHEVPTLSSEGTATFRARIANDDQSFDWTLTYSGLNNVLQAHVHFGAPAINGGIVVFLCTNLGNAPASPPATPVAACPSPAATLSGTARAADVAAGAAAQGIAAGEFAKVIAAIRAGATYANVHTTLRPGGEIRGPIHSHSDH